MVVETAKNQIILNQKVGSKKETRQVETDIIVNDIKPDVLNVISTNGIVNIYKKEAMDGKIKIDGSINTYVIYIADDEKASVRSLNTSLDFTQIIDIENTKENMQVQTNIEIKDFDTRIINGRKLNIKANLEISVNVYSNESFDVITDIKNISDVQALNNQETITTLVGTGTNRVTAKDTVSIDTADDLAEIMKVDFKIIDEETKISYNKILSKADALVEVMYLTTDNRINKVMTKIPVMGFVDMQNINENCECAVQNVLTNFMIKPNNKDEHSISIETEIEITCLAYESKKINIIQDLYSITNNISFVQKEINAVTERNKINSNYQMQENIRIPELNGKVLDVEVNPTIENMSVRNGKIIYEGNLNLRILFEQNNTVMLRTVDLQFNHDITSDKIYDKSSVETILKVVQNDTIVKDGIIEVTVVINFEILEEKNQKLNMIEEINVEDNTECSTYSMIIYFVKPGDTLWKIAKMFKSTVDDIAKINEIENPNNINVGRQLYIPKFCKNKIAI